MLHAQASKATASADTVKTLIDTIQIPQTARKIVGVWCHNLGGAGMTTLQNVTGIFELESDDLALVPMQFPLDCVPVVGSGVGSLNPRIFPVAIPTVGGERIRGYVTLDLATTIHNTARFGLITE